MTNFCLQNIEWCYVFIVKPGIRVAAILSSNGKNINFIGYGKYVGDDVPGLEAVGPMAEAMRKNGQKNPKIILDNGDVVWGCECWWGDADDFEKKFAGRKLNQVDLNKFRQDARIALASRRGGIDLDGVGDLPED
jgi:hypothetical protein